MQPEMATIVLLEVANNSVKSSKNEINTNTADID